MKKILTLMCAVICFSSAMNAQDASKKFRFGLRLSPTPYWLRTDDTKKFSGGGSRFGFGFGLQLEYRLTDVVSFSTGIGGDFEGGKQKYLNVTDPNSFWCFTYFTDKSDNLVQSSDLATDSAKASKSDNVAYLLNSRSVKTTYVTIPIALKMMTGEISGLKYYGVFGANIGILTKARATDQLTKWSSNYGTGSSSSLTSSTKELTDVNIYNDCIPVKVGLNVGLGAEYRLAGSTSAFFSLNYLRSFTNMYKNPSNYAISNAPNTITGGISKAKQGAYGDGFQINVGILF